MRALPPMMDVGPLRRYRDRRHAGQALAAELKEYANRPDVAVLALPRGGVPVASEVARALDVPLDVFVVRKLGFPGQEELAMGAIASGGVRVLNREIAAVVSDAELEAAAQRELHELVRREQRYRGGRPPLDVRGRTAILIDDGLATGASMRAAVAALRQRGPARIVVAVPVAAQQTCAQLRGEADEVVCAITPAEFFAVGLWYEDFRQTTDEEVQQLLAEAAGFGRPARAPATRE
jgi:putative phosphoribosyl transferase